MAFEEEGSARFVMCGNGRLAYRLARRPIRSSSQRLLIVSVIIRSCTLTNEQTEVRMKSAAIALASHHQNDGRWMEVHIGGENNMGHGAYVRYSVARSDFIA